MNLHYLLLQGSGRAQYIYNRIDKSFYIHYLDLHINHILTDYESNNFQGDTAQLKNNFNSHFEDYELRLVKGLLDVDFG